jgi:hypothetical protein
VRERRGVDVRELGVDVVCLPARVENGVVRILIQETHLEFLEFGSRCLRPSHQSNAGRRREREDVHWTTSPRVSRPCYTDVPSGRTRARARDRRRIQRLRRRCTRGCRGESRQFKFCEGRGEDAQVLGEVRALEDTGGERNLVGGGCKYDISPSSTK